MEPYSGNKAKIYSIIPEGEKETLFEKFVDEYKANFKDEIKDILKRLMQIGHTTGARESFLNTKAITNLLENMGNMCGLYMMMKKGD